MTIVNPAPTRRDRYSARTATPCPHDLFRHATQIRRWALRVLLLWLFGAVTGIAHACLMAAPAPAAGVTHLHASSAPGAAAPCHEAEDSDDSTLVSCQAFCDKASVSAPSVKSGPDDGAAHAAAAPPSLLVTLPVACAPVQPWVPRRDGVRPQPIPIAFLRLTR